MLSVRSLVKDFGARRAVDGVSFEVEKGTVLGFLGPNGAGKSTTMRMITGLLPPTSGTARIKGFDIQDDPIAARAELGYLPENAPSYPEMTVQEFLRFMAEMRGFRGAERNARADAAMEKCFLGHVRHQTIETLSKGYRQRTCFAQAILHDPAVLILDEPTDGLDPNQKFVVRRMIKEMAAEKVIVLSTHVLEEVDAICSRVIIINQGKVVADNTPAELLQQGRMDDVFRRLTVTEDAASAQAK
jgi:ABC-2 type transport system ATP-binding protein